MARKIEKRYEKLLEQWRSPKDAGEAIGFITTSFTFHSSFFEEECISRFLLLESDPDEDGILYQIEREEKIRKTSCCSVWVDKANCNGIRNIGWDLVPVKVPGTFHPKISILYWANCIRLIIASANLTEDGYCRNQEVFGVLDYYSKDLQKDEIPPPANVIKESLNFLRSIMGKHLLCGDKIKNKYSGFFDKIQRTITDWGIKNDTGLFVYPLFIGNGNQNCFDQISKIWNKYESVAPGEAYITSPFYDNPESENKPSNEIWNILKQRGSAYVNYYLIADKTDDKVYIKAPESITNHPSKRNDTGVNLFRVNEQLTDEDGKPIYRQLHAKSIWLEGSRYALFMVGSSNFTSPGLGISKNRNYEANLVYIVDKRNKNDYQALEQSLIDGEKIWEEELIYQPEKNTDQIYENESSVINFFQYCEVGIINGKKILSFFFDINYKPDDFNVINNKNILFDHQAWVQNGKKEIFLYKWEEDSIPCGFEIKINNDSISYWLPLNVSEVEALPEIIELKKLPLDIIAQIMGSLRPIHVILRKYYAKLNRENTNSNNGLTHLNPHKRVDTSRFLLQRTRKISYSLNSLKEKLSKPFYTVEAIDWRMNGPVGVNAFVKALIKEITQDGVNQQKQEETLFFIAELLLEISNIEPQENINSIKKGEVFRIIYQSMDKMISGQMSMLKSCPDSTIKLYSESTIKMALKKLKDEMAI